MYIDLNNKFLKPLSEEVAAISNSIRNLLLTKKGSLPGDPDFGSNLWNYLFEPFSTLVELEITSQVVDLLNKYEKRIEVISSDVIYNYDYNSIDITIYFRIIFTGDEYDLNLRLKK